MKNIKFRICGIDDLDIIMNFIGRNYDGNHILAKDKKFLMYEHSWQNRLNFMSAFDQKDELVGIVGFHQYSDSEIGGHISSTMLRVKQNCSIPFVGMKLLMELKKQLKPESICGVTTNKDTVAPYIGRFLGHIVGKFSHYYIPNDRLSKFSIIKGLKNINKIPSPGYMPKVFIEEFNKIDELFTLNSLKLSFTDIPFKSINYLLRRYFLNPIFNYRFFKCVSEGADALLILKEERVMGVSILRVIDYIGELKLLNNISFCLRDLVYEEYHEYCDMFCSSGEFLIPDQNCYIEKNSKEVIVPHYFYPYESNNIEVLYETDMPNQVYFKGHGDGDRPNFRLFL